MTFQIDSNSQEAAVATVRRIYIYVVCALSLEGLALNIGSLLRSLLLPELNTPRTEIAFQIAAVLVGTPVFLVHWLWAQRLARSDAEERFAGLRVFYLRLALAGLLGQTLYAAYHFLWELVSWALPGAEGWCDYGECGSLSAPGALLYFALPFLVLSLLWLYHWRVAARDERFPEAREGLNGSLVRLYRFGFSAAGLLILLRGAGELLNRLMSEPPQGVNLNAYYDLRSILPSLLLGLMAWLVFWRQAQRSFHSPDPDEQSSALRKFYLYAWLFEATVATVTFLALLLTSLFRRLLSLEVQGSLADVLPWLIVHAILWAYHAAVLRQDMRAIPEAPRQAGVRRLYHYLLATVGLAAFLAGAGALLNALILAFELSLGSSLRERLAWGAAAALAGLPVWWWNWRQVQTLALQPGAEGTEDRGSLTRKIYLYLFVLAATLTAAACAIYLVYQILLAAMGVESLSLSDVALPLGYALIAVAVWIYHGLALRSDWRLTQQAGQARLAAIRVLVVDAPGGSFGAAFLALLHKELPGLQVDCLEAAAAEYPGLAEASLLVVSAPLLAQYPALSAAVQSAAGRKLILPGGAAGWEWVGVDAWDEAALLRHARRAVQQALAGEAVRLLRPMPVSAIILLALLGLVALMILISLVASLVQGPL